ncbi:streptomycin biosynthesis protein StrI [Russula earlei]|uniref:Streptomycin biosynthesis protein StrI n=1 Tax=Russula earlei TaxID=71964 RepID=A0ACC0UQ18_9AGAM|nr:streptomycin biosynthesis protein StrI [Russula earlei]
MTNPNDVKIPAEPVTLAIIGCGQRGRAYAGYAILQPLKCKVVAIAEPRPKTRALFADRYGVDGRLAFESWERFHKASAEAIQAAGKRLADAVIVAVQDNMHAEVVEAFAAQGYDILCEKPMATSVEQCLRIEAAVKGSGIIFGLGHVLRYSPYSRAITEIVCSGKLGRLVNAQHLEPVGHWHFAHSYVRGNWSKESESSFSLMTKSCQYVRVRLAGQGCSKVPVHATDHEPPSHSDIDIMCHWFSPDTPVRVSSFGGLQHFRRSAKPAEAGDATRCLDCAYEPQCPYSAKKIYLDRVARGHTSWPVSPLVDGIPDIENVSDALAEGPYGKCAYECDNDVCDNQVVNIQYASGATVSFTMVAYTTLVCDRQTRLHFTHGEIIGDMRQFTVTDFRTGQTTVHRPRAEGGGHGGGDYGLAQAFVEAVWTRQQGLLGTDVTDVLKSHLTVFAAEHSRKTGSVVDCVEFENAARRAWDGNRSIQNSTSS